MSLKALMIVSFTMVVVTITSITLYLTFMAKQTTDLATTTIAAIAQNPGQSIDGFTVGVPIGGYVCPVAGKVSFIDSWHFPRSGGRLHKGQDMFAKKGTPLVALISGVISKKSYGTRLGGNSLWITGASGESWYYAHLDSFANLSVGDRVAQGQFVGTVGNTGNARTTPAHLHIQYRPGGLHSRDVNNYFILNPACPR